MPKKQTSNLERESYLQSLIAFSAALYSSWRWCQAQCKLYPFNQLWLIERVSSKFSTLWCHPLGTKRASLIPCKMPSQKPSHLGHKRQKLNESVDCEEIAVKLYFCFHHPIMKLLFLWDWPSAYKLDIEQTKFTRWYCFASLELQFWRHKLLTMYRM